MSSARSPTANVGDVTGRRIASTEKRAPATKSPGRGSGHSRSAGPVRFDSALDREGADPGSTQRRHVRRCYDLDRAGLAEILDGEPRFRVRQVWDALYRRLAEPAECTDLPAGLRERMAAHPSLAPSLTKLSEQEVGRRGPDDAEAGRERTIKWLFGLEDGPAIETVLMGYHDRSTVCVSSQAGCAMGCTFCATGQGGYRRQLRPGEIVEQVARATRAARDRGMNRLGNVVFMGMGEPLANYRSVAAAITTLTDEMGFSARRITVSTVGIVPGIERMAADGRPVGLALSLHAANDQLRSELVPQNRRHGLAELAGACELWTRSTGRRLTLEWACMKGVNDSARDVTELSRFARRLGAHVNLIPLNPTPGWRCEATPASRVEEMADQLRRSGVNATVRRNRGRSIAAACGQLASRSAGTTVETAPSSAAAHTPALPA